MPSIRIKDVPEQTHAVLRRRTAMAQQSLQNCLRRAALPLTDLVELPTADARLANAPGPRCQFELLGSAPRAG